MSTEQYSLDRLLGNSAQFSSRIFDFLPKEAKKWAEGLGWNERRYVLSLCHLLCAATPEQQAQFLNEYTADGLVTRLLEDRDTKQKVDRYLQLYRIDTQLTESVLRKYIRQFYIHCAQDLRRQPTEYLEAAIELMGNTEEINNSFNYILGFELLKMLFQMSWKQHERLCSIQSNQEDFFYTYIKPIQHAHTLNGIVVPKDKKKFFAKRDYFVQIPNIRGKKLTELVMATFAAEVAIHFGFTIIRHANALRFNYDFVCELDPEDIFRA